MPWGAGYRVLTRLSPLPVVACKLRSKVIGKAEQDDRRGRKVLVSKLVRAGALMQLAEGRAAASARHGALFAGRMPSGLRREGSTWSDSDMHSFVTTPCLRHA